MIWAAGIQASPAGEWIGAKCDRAGRILVNPDLSVPDHPEIFAIGDTAAAFDAEGKLLPGVAPVAKQQGVYVANLIDRPHARRRLAEAVPLSQLRQFRHHRPQSARSSISAGSICAGSSAWILWSFAHVYFLIGFRNRIVVAINGCGLISPSSAARG